MHDDATYAGDWVLSAIIEDRAHRLGDRVALVTHDESFTYADLRDVAARVAGGLQALGVEPGDRVATMLDITPAHVAAWFGSAWAGAVEVPINTEYKGTFLEHVVAESQAKVLVCEARYAPRLAGLVLPDLRHVVFVGDDADEVPDAPAGVTVHRLRDMMGHAPVARVPRSEQDLLYVLYTSGTTGPSKGVMHCNRSALWTARVWVELFEMTSEDVAYSFLPLYHVTARSALATSTFLVGGTLALRERFSVSEFWSDVRRFGATCACYMGVVVSFLWKQDARPDDAENTLRVAGGAAAPPDIADAFERRFGCKLVEVYGMTEIGTASGPMHEPIVRGTMGRPFSHLELEVHDEQDRPLPVGAPGEICVRPREPYAIMQGYWRRPEDTVDAWRNLWFHTGDMGRYTEDGHIVFVDRIKDSMRRRGENISSFEIERAVHAHPAVLECAAYAVPSEHTEDEVMVAVVRKDGHALEAVELFEFCKETMPRFAVPRYLRFLDALPKTPTARVEKYKLRDEGIAADAADRERLGIALPRV